MDRNGYLVNSDGKYLVGVTAGPDIVLEAGDTGILPADAPVAAVTEGANLFDEEGNLAPEDGEVGPIRVPQTAQSMSISQDGTVTYVDLNGDLQWAGQLVLAKFSIQAD